VNRQYRGARNYLAGVSAENSVAATYRRLGYTITAQRWRGSRGEVDLIAYNKETVVFIEVKKGPTHELAATRLTQPQIARLFATATEFAASEPAGQMTPMRFDLATVDRLGTVEIRENAFMTA